MQTCAHTLQCDFHAQIVKHGFLFPKLIATDVTVRPKQNDSWSWSARKIECSFSLFRLFTYWNIPLFLVIEGVDCVSIIDEQRQCAILDFFDEVNNVKTELFHPTIQTMLLSDGKIEFREIRTDIQTLLRFHGHYLEDGEETSVQLSVFDGEMGNRAYPQCISKITGIIDRFFYKNKTILQIKGICTESQEPVSFRGIYENNAGRFSLSTQYPHCFLDPIVYTKQSSKVSGKCTLLFLQKIFCVPEIATGSVVVQCALDDTKVNFLHGFIVLENVASSERTFISSAKIHINSKGEEIFGQIQSKTAAGELEGKYIYNMSQVAGSCTLKNKNDGMVEITPFRFLDGKTNSFVCTMCENTIDISVTGTILDTLQHINYPCVLKTGISLREGAMIRGSCGVYKVGGVGLWKDSVLLSCFVKNNEKTLFSFIYDSDKKDSNLHGFCEDILLKKCVHFFSDTYLVYGEGLVKFSGLLRDQNLELSYAFQNGVFEIPYIHNFISRSSGNLFLDFSRKNVRIVSINAECSQGTVEIKDAEIQFDDAYKISTCKIPLIVSRCAVSPQKYFHTLLSGAVTVSKKKSEKFHVSGDVTVHEGIVKQEELFADVDHDSVRAPITGTNGVTHEVHILSEKPIRVDTKQLSTDVVVDVVSMGDLHNPSLQGSVQCIRGELLFPYQSLHIARGKILFSGGTIHDAAIELFAKNIVKNYHISMHAIGSIGDYAFIFDSTPTLSQSHILSLLLFGSLQESSNIFMPALFSHSVKLGSFDIHFLPGFSDKSGRGGIRGALEIAVNNRLRAMIQKNFTLSEDTRFELEYALTDMISLRAIRDERRDIGGEVELRWKF